MRDLAGKTILGFTQLLIVLGLLILAPAWTFDYWQAWVYLMVFAASSAAITLYLWKKDPQLLERRTAAGARIMVGTTDDRPTDLHHCMAAPR